MNAGEEKKGTGPICRNGPEGAAHKLDPSPFSRTPSQDRIFQLLSAEADGWLEAEERRELLELLRRDPRARAAYAEQAILNSLLFHKARCGEGPAAGDQRRGLVGSPAIDLPVSAAVEHPVGAAVELPRQLDLESQISNLPFPPLSTTHYPLPATQFVGSWAFSYMVATVVMGVAILGFWAYKITHHQHIAEAPSQSVPSDVRPEMVFVGRITGMVDVKWSDDPRYLPPPGFAHVPLGRKYILDAGLMEITYDSGAKVILEGPCAYEVESTAGGYLALGKLTAKVVSGQWPVASAKPQAANQKSPSFLILHPSSLFSVRTPTAIVTDLGTEFGVEVDSSGCSLTHVFQGKVEVRLAGPGKENGNAIQLAENESVRVDGKGWERVLDAENTTDEPKNFVRRMPAAPKPSPVKVLAWFRMGDDDPGAVAGDVASEETVDHEGRFTLSRLGEPSYSAGEVSVGGQFSVRFHGSPGEGFFNSNALCPIRDNFVLEAWVKVRKFTDRTTLIVYNGHTGRDGFGLIVRDGHWQYLFGGIGIFDSGVPVELGKWTHVALVHQWGSARIWVNGRLVGEPIASWRPYPPEGVFQIGGEQSNPRLSINAEIDEVRLSVLWKRFRPEMLLFPASSASHSPAGEEKGGLPTK